jgi:hypothetical protein
LPDWDWSVLSAMGAAQASPARKRELRRRECLKTKKRETNLPLSCMRTVSFPPGAGSPE